MIIRDFTYKGISLSDSVAGTTKIVVQEVNKDVQLRTATFDRANFHGTNTSFTLASGRLFTVSGVIFGSTRADRATGQNVLASIIAPESNPTPDNKGFYDLTWVDDNGDTMVASAKVYSMPKYGHENGTPIIEFSFELYSEESFYTSNSDSEADGGYGYIGGAALPFTLPVALDDIVGAITVNNYGNFAAPCKVEVIGSIVAPKINNTTSGQSYGVSVTTTDFVLDTRGDTPIITDVDVDISAYRSSGSSYISVLPGINYFVLQGSDYSPDSTVTVAITYRDTYISS